MYVYVQEDCVSFKVCSDFKTEQTLVLKSPKSDLQEQLWYESPIGETCLNVRVSSLPKPSKGLFSHKDIGLLSKFKNCLLGKSIKELFYV